MTKRPRPTMHGRDHAPDGPDPIPGLVLDGGGDTPTFDYAGATSPGIIVAATSSGYLNFTGTNHSSGITISGTDLTIGTAGVYEILAAGFGEVLGPAAYPTTLVSSLGLTLRVNGSETDSIYTVAQLPFDIPSDKYWEAPMTVLGQRALDASDVLTFRAGNNLAVSATFARFTVVVRQLA